jgi:hypothetical protein
VDDVQLHPEELDTFSEFLAWADYYHSNQAWVYLANLIEEHSIWYSLVEDYHERVDAGTYKPYEGKFHWNQSVYPAFKLRELHKTCGLLYAGMAVGRDWGRADEWARQRRIRGAKDES